tara:strand:- start:96 stop:2324 length:2229 start_codon:yes stop_codon:yes gene_type:complete
MLRILIKFSLSLVILLGLLIGYLSFFGIETNSFNKLIQEKVSKSNENVNAKLEKVKILLNLSRFSINLQASDVDLLFENKIVKLRNISTNYSLKSFINREFGIKNVFISTKDNNLSDIINFIRVYKNSAQLIILDKILSKGLINANLEINFKDDGKIDENYKIEGKIKGAEINLLNRNNISKIDLDFDIQKKIYLFKNTKAEFEEIKLSAPDIKITDREKSFFVEGNIKSQTDEINKQILSIFAKKTLENLDIKNLKLSSENNFSFIINKKFKISDFLIKSKINLENADIKINSEKINKIHTKNDGYINFKDHKIQLDIGENKILIKGEGKYLLDKENEKISYVVSNLNEKIDFSIKLDLNKKYINLKILDYEKDETTDASLLIEGEYKKNKNLNFKKILLTQSKNNFLINDLNLTKDFKIDYISLVDLDFVNNSKKINKIVLKKNKKNYQIKSKIFDSSNLLEEILFGKDEGGISRFFYNLNAGIKIELDKVFIGDSDFIKNLNSEIRFKKNKLINLDLSGTFINNKKINLTIRTNQNKEKITTLFSGNAKPLVKKYKFIKGFEEGSLDFYSIKKNNISNSKLKIVNFKLKEVPALTKILTLASLQGIADLLTGEGIRFDEFEMDFSSKKNLMTINEIYSIGPAISLMMEGYVQGKDLVSLKGTLVPATTLNKFVGSIPVLGKILVGKKTGEGVFGVSFKIKGPPKNLKTTVNPIKTLTPRFITRTLEKIKKDGVEVKSTP